MAAVDPIDAARPGGAIARATGEAMVMRVLGAIRDFGGDAEAPVRQAGVELNASEILSGQVDRLTTRELHMLAGHANIVASNMDADRSNRAHFRGGDYRLLFYCLVGEHSLRQAIERAEEVFTAVDNRLGSLELNVEGETARLKLGRKHCEDDALSFTVALHGLTNYHNILEWLIGSHIPAIAELDIAPAFAEGMDADLAPFTLRMGRPEKSLCFAASFLDYPVIRSFDEYSIMPHHNFLFEVPTRDTGLDIAERARRCMGRVLREDGSLCSLGQVGDMLCLSEITLRRRLASAGTSFRDLRDGVRRQFALELLRRTALPIDAISERLDFCDSDAFRRAMQTWIGQSPSAYRRGAQSGELI